MHPLGQGRVNSGMLQDAQSEWMSWETTVTLHAVRSLSIMLTPGSLGHYICWLPGLAKGPGATNLLKISLTVSFENMIEAEFLAFLR